MFNQVDLYNYMAIVLYSTEYKDPNERHQNNVNDVRNLSWFIITLRKETTCAH